MNKLQQLQFNCESGSVDSVVELLYYLYKDDILFADDSLYVFSDKWRTFWSFDDMLRKYVNNNVITKLKSIDFRDQIRNKIKKLFKSNISFDANLNLLGLQDCVYDNELQIFKPYEKNDFVNYYANWNYYLKPEYIKEIKTLFDNVLPGINIRNYVMKLIVIGLFKNVESINYLLFVTENNNGKILLTLICYAFGWYSGYYEDYMKYTYRVRCFYSTCVDKISLSDTKKNVYLTNDNYIINNCDIACNLRVVKLKNSTEISNFDYNSLNKYSSSVMFVLFEYWKMYQIDGLCDVESIVRWTEKYKQKQIMREINS